MFHLPATRSISYFPSTDEISLTDRAVSTKAGQSNLGINRLMKSKLASVSLMTSSTSEKTRGKLSFVQFSISCQLQFWDWLQIWAEITYWRGKLACCGWLVWPLWPVEYLYWDEGECVKWRFSPGKAEMLPGNTLFYGPGNTVLYSLNRNQSRVSAMAQKRQTPPFPLTLSQIPPFLFSLSL